MSRSWRTAAVLIVAGLALAVAACTGGEPAPPAVASPVTTQQPPSPPTGTAPGVPTAPATGPADTAWPTRQTTGPSLMLRRTGGFAGVSQTVVVTPDGRWVYADRRDSGAARRGRLARPDLDRLRGLLARPALASEARVTPAPPSCADGFGYALIFGELTVTWNACGDGREPPTAGAIVQLIESSTAF